MTLEEARDVVDAREARRFEQAQRDPQAKAALLADMEWRAHVSDLAVALSRLRNAEQGRA